MLSRICGKTLEGLSINLLRVHTLSVKNPFVSKYNKEITSVLSEKKLQESFMDHSIALGGIKVKVLSKDYDTGEEIEVEAEVSHKIECYPDFKQSNHALSLETGKSMTLAGDGEVYNSFINLSYLAEDSGSFVRSGYQPCHISNSDLYNNCMRMGIPIKNSSRDRGFEVSEGFLKAMKRLTPKVKSAIKSVNKYSPRLVMSSDVKLISVKVNGEAQGKIDSLRTAGGMNCVFTLKSDRVIRDTVNASLDQIRLCNLIKEEDREYLKQFFQHNDKDGYYFPRKRFEPKESDRKRISLYDPNSGEMVTIKAKDIEKNSATFLASFHYIEGGIKNPKPIPLDDVDFLNDANSGISFKSVGSGDLATVVVDRLRSPEGSTIKVNEYEDGCTPHRSRSIFAEGKKRVAIHIDGLPKNNHESGKRKNRKPNPDEDESLKITFDTFDESIVGIKSPLDPFMIVFNEKNTDMVRIYGSDIPDAGLKKRADNLYATLVIAARMMEKSSSDNLQLNWDQGVSDEVKSVVGSPEGLIFSNAIKSLYKINYSEVKYLATSIEKMRKKIQVQEYTENLSHSNADSLSSEKQEDIEELAKNLLEKQDLMQEFL
jgi:hypothetical protein